MEEGGLEVLDSGSEGGGWGNWMLGPREEARPWILGLKGRLGALVLGLRVEAQEGELDARF